MNPETRKELSDATSALLNYLSVTDEPTSADIIWGLGSNDTLVAKKAAELYRRGFAELIVFSGGNGHRWAELAGTEAGLFKSVAVGEGVTESAILTEELSTNTSENVSFTSEILRSRGITVRSAILITIPPFQRRAQVTVSTRAGSISCVNCPADWGPVEAWDDDRLSSAARLCAGEIRRLREYPLKGFIRFDPDRIPHGVLDAAERVERLIASRGEG